MLQCQVKVFQLLLLLPVIVLTEPDAHPDVLVPLQRPLEMDCPGQS